jgi:hypothetical protein
VCVCVRGGVCVEFGILIQSTKRRRKQTQMTSTQLPYVALHITFTHKYARASVCECVSGGGVCVYSFMNRCYNCAGRRDAKKKMPSRVNTRWHGKNNMI